MDKGLSLFNFVKTGGYDASLITTYAVNFQLYEQLLLRRLISSGCRYNVLLVDERQLAASWVFKELRPEAAGVTYTLFPVKAGGAFHPKIWFLAGRKKAALFIGSHNLTFGGLGHNREISALLELGVEPDLQLDGVCRDAWDALRSWVQRCEGRVPGRVVEAVYRFEEFLRPFLRHAGKNPTVQLHWQGANKLSLLEEFAFGIGQDVKRIAVVGPYLDTRLEFLRSLRERWPSAKIFVAITPEALESKDVLKIPHFQCVDARLIGDKDRHGFVHAKALYIEAAQDTHVLLVGSANPSAPAWTQDHAEGNAEAMLRWTGRAAQQTAERLGFTDIFDLPRLEVASVELNSWRERAGDDDSQARYRVGVAQFIQASRTIELNLDSDSRMVRYALLSSSGAILHTAPFLGHGLLSLPVPESIKGTDVRGVEIHAEDRLLLMAWIHNVAEIENLASASAKILLKRALSSLTCDEGNIAEVLDAVQKVIFEDGQEVVISTRVASGGNRAKAIRGSEMQPDSLAVDVASIARRSHRVRVLKSGDLAYLIDVLMRRLAIDSDAPSASADRLGRSEEEQVGKEDAASSSDDDATQAAAAENELAGLIGRKVKSLVRRLTQYLEGVAHLEEHTGRALARVIAVLALVRELRRIESFPRWRIAGLKLVPFEPREDLYACCVEHLLGEDCSLLQRFEMLAGVRTEECGHARALLTWLAWDIGDEYTERFPLTFETEETEHKLQANAALFELLAAVAADKEELDAVKESLYITSPVALRARQRQHAWFERHSQLGSKWSNLRSEVLELVPRKSKVELGDIAVVTTSDSPKARIVVEVGDRHIGLSALDSVKSFQSERVSALRV